MSKIIFFCIPAHGHTNPTLGVVKELIQRGHEIWYYSYNSMKDKITSTGAHFVSCDIYDPQTQLTKDDGERIGKDLAFSTNLIVDMTLALDDAIISDMKKIKPDVIVADSMAYWGKLIAKKLDIPFVSSTTTFAFNRHSSKIMRKSSSGLLSVLKAMPKINKSLKRLRAKGYDVKNVLDLIQNDNDTNTIVYTAASFQPCSDTFSDKYQFVGPCMREITQPLEKTEVPTIYISLGTVINEKLDFYKKCIEAFKTLDYRVIISVGEAIDISSLGQIPSHFIILPKVDQMAVLSVSDVFVTHCGMNSVNEALYYGVPLVMMPLTPEQQGVAHRCLEVGVGVMLENADVHSIKNAVNKILDTPQYQETANCFSSEFQSLNAAFLAADFIERIVNNH